MENNDHDTTDTSAPGVGPDLGGGASTPESDGGASGGSGAGGTGGDADTFVDPDPVDDANPQTNGAN